MDFCRVYRTGVFCKRPYRHQSLIHCLESTIPYAFQPRGITAYVAVRQIIEPNFAVWHTQLVLKIIKELTERQFIRPLCIAAVVLLADEVGVEEIPERFVKLFVFDFHTGTSGRISARV
jgi:hypothetical protein